LKLIWRGTALNDLKAIISYIAERNVTAARRLQDDIEACAERLPDHPFMYRRGRIPNTREAVVHPNYILVYRVGHDAIEVVNVMHSRRRYP
jgi:addiction module RelE/StbE family toxin